MNVLGIIYNQVGLKDIIDILIVTVIIYQLLKIVHGTRAFQTLFGLASLMALFWIGLYYKLHSLNWLLNHFFDSFFVIFIILFQDQIRSALTNLGTGKKVFGVFNKEDLDLDIEEIVEVCGVLSREKTGALIVFERRNGLANYVGTGTKVDAEIHSDIIYSIFQTRSPLHDGAIIVSGGKIAAAGCFLPLSKNVEIDRHLGTRHRAALGMSETTDAVVVTVSEETGKIHICLDGNFYFCEVESHLRKYLKHIVSHEKLDSSLRPIKMRES